MNTAPGRVEQTGKKCVRTRSILRPTRSGEEPSIYLEALSSQTRPYEYHAAASKTSICGVFYRYAEPGKLAGSSCEVIESNREWPCVIDIRDVSERQDEQAQADRR
jgi:hypothetical protein